MADDAIDSAIPPVDESEVDEIVQQVVFEVSGGVMGIGPGKSQLGPAKVTPGLAAAPARQALAAGGAGAGGGRGGGRDDGAAGGAAGGGADNTEAMQSLQDRFKKL